MTEKKNRIYCPKCGREYTASEIYIPADFIGKTECVIRNEDGCIEYFKGEDMNTKETYTCDNCDTTFQVEAEIKFKTTVDPLHDFTEEYSSELYSNRIILTEND